MYCPICNKKIGKNNNLKWKPSFNWKFLRGPLANHIKNKHHEFWRGNLFNTLKEL